MTPESRNTIIAMILALLIGLFLGILIAKTYLIPAPVLHFDCPDTSDFFIKKDLINPSANGFDYNTTPTTALRVENINTIKE